MGELAMRLVAGAIIVLVLSMAVACEVAIWDECRAAGHSRLVCLRWVSR